MCGISGFIDPSLSQNDAKDLIAKQLLSIKHRGPDFSDSWQDGPLTLGHNRLSIIDLTDHGNQPMHYRQFTIIYNGEIYNYVELKKELQAKGHRFESDCDTEVILAAYAEWGAAAVERFVGMWSFAIWDKNEKKFFCSRDRFGIKPFYYIAEGEKFYFASEVKPLQQSSIFANDLNLQQVARGLQLGWVVYEDETWFEKIKALPAAHNLSWQNGKFATSRYWDIEFGKKDSRPFDQKVEEFRELFMESIQLHMRSDVEVGGCLSGGIDSSAIAAAVGKLYPQKEFKTFTIFYEGEGAVDERPFAKEVLAKYPHLKGYFLQPTDADLQEHLEQIVLAQDFPLLGSSPVSQYFVMKLAAQHQMKVLLDGQGSDEYLVGYMHSFYRLIGGAIKHFQLMKAHHRFWDHVQEQQFGPRKKADVFMKSALAGLFSEQQLYGLEFKQYFPFLTNISPSPLPFNLEKKGKTRLDQFLYHLVFHSMLPTLLHLEDRNSMAFSIESRVPFLDHRLVEFAFALPDEDKVGKGRTKYIFREAVKDILPEKIYTRTDKKGFVTPGEVKWLRGPLQHLLEQNFSQMDFLNQNKVQRVLQEYRNGDNKNAILVWRLALLKKWLDQV